MGTITRSITGKCGLCDYTISAELSQDPETAAEQEAILKSQISEHEAIPIVEGDYQGLIVRNTGVPNIVFIYFKETLGLDQRKGNLNQKHGRIYSRATINTEADGMPERIRSNDSPAAIGSRFNESAMAIASYLDRCDKRRARVPKDLLQRLNDCNYLEELRGKVGGTFRTLEE